MNKRRTALMLAGLLLSGASQAADGTLTLTVENDVFTGSDNNYTNGVGIAWVSGDIDPDDQGALGQWTRLWSFLPFVADDGYTTYASWALAQEINTRTTSGSPIPMPMINPTQGCWWSTAPSMPAGGTGATLGNSNWGWSAPPPRPTTPSGSSIA